MKECPMCSVETAIATQTRDMGVENKDAWAWGVVCGWDAESNPEAGRRWDPAVKQRLQRLHERWDALHLANCVSARFHARAK